MWPRAAAAQQAIPIVGFLAPMSRDAVSFQTSAFRKGLAESGLAEGGNLAIDFRWANDRVEQLPALAADLVGRQAKVIAAFSSVAARAAKAATSSIPVVFVTGDDPIAAGLVTSLSRPEANITGITFGSSSLGAKRLELLRMLLPKQGPIAVITDPNSPESVTQSRDVEDVARTLAQPVIVVQAATDGEIEAAFATMRRQTINAFFACGGPFFNSRRDLIASLASKDKIPGMYSNRNYVNAGGLISYGAGIPEAYHHAGIYVGRILKGARPADLPVLQPTKFELVINLKSAKALDLEVPDRLMALADDVIE
jgi:putative ABC transport system substrate-binding protein